jgi:hypothetical protein
MKTQAGLMQWACTSRCCIMFDHSVCICPGKKVPFYPKHGRVENPDWPPLNEAKQMEQSWCAFRSRCC